MRIQPARTCSKRCLDDGILRRLSTGFSKPDRITPSLEGVFILCMIATLMVTDFLFDGSRIAMAAAEQAAVWPMPAAGSRWVVGKHFGTALMGIEHSAVDGRVGFLVASLPCSSFLISFPTRNTCTCLVIPNVFFLNLGSPGKLSDMDLEDKAESFGAGRAEDLTWKQMLDLYPAQNAVDAP